jgi:hypothetical protein
MPAPEARTPLAPPVALPAPDAALPHVVATRGGACGECAPGLTCLALPGGYCGTSCDDAACDGACTETRTGRVCLQACTTDASCRAGDGYRCDPQWHACAIPGSTAIVPKQCPRTGAEHDVAFGDSEARDVGRGPTAIVEPPPAKGETSTTSDGFAWLYESPSGVSSVAGAITEVARDGRAPRLARGRDGVVGVWRSGDTIALATSRDAVAWSKPIALDERVDASGSPLIAIGADPQKRVPELVYVLAGAQGLGMRVRVSHDGGATFAPAVTAMTATYGNAVAGGDGRLHVVAIDGDALGGWGSAMQTIQYAVSSDGGASFGKPIVVSGRDEVLPFYFANPSIAVDDRRKLVYVAYVLGGRDGAWDIVVATTKDAGKTWTRTAIGDGCAMHMVPNLAIDPTTGILHLAYYDTSGGSRFVHATCASGGASCTAWGAINTIAFEPLSTMPLGARWIGDHGSLVVDDKRRLLHALWTQPARDGMRVVHAVAKLRR